tara:strand:- start:952 stop:1341 length:390 start_codon:yes stop_codon:yes gene_type:complete
LFPKSISDALTRYSLPRNSSIIGKQDMPGAKDDNNIVKVFPFLESLLIFVIFKIEGLSRKIKRFKAIPAKGRYKKSSSILKLINEIKIVAGRDILSINFLIPSFSGLSPNLFFNNIPKIIRRKNTAILE